MNKFTVEPTVGDGHAGEAHLEVDESNSATHGGDDFATKVTIIGAVVVGAALIEAALIPGIIIGGIAAAFAPKYLPKLGETLQPMIHSTMREAYKLGRKARSMAGEVQEQMSDIAAEVKAEDIVNASEGQPPAVGIVKHGGVLSNGMDKVKS